MRIKLKSSEAGGIFFWALAFIVIICIMVWVYVKTVQAVKRIEIIRPKWDDVYIEAYDQARQIAIAEGGDPDILGLFQIPEVFPMGYGLVVRSPSLSAINPDLVTSAVETDCSGWTTNSVNGHSVEFIKLDLNSLDAFTPEIDLNVPAMFYHRYFIKTNFSYDHD